MLGTNITQVKKFFQYKKTMLKSKGINTVFINHNDDCYIIMKAYLTSSLMNHIHITVIRGNKQTNRMH